jgi:hypothetical protein
MNDKPPDLFDLNEGRHRKEVGMSDAENNPKRAEGLALAREIAFNLARQYGEVSADMVGTVLKRDHDIDSLGPAAGSIFKGDEWEFTGERKKSVRVTNHSRELKIWRLKTSR